MLRESLGNLIRRQCDMEVVGEVFEPNPIDLLFATNDVRPDVVVVDLPDWNEDPGICSHLLSENPRILVLALSTTRESAFLYRQSISKEQLPTASNEAILGAIRKWA